MYCVIADASDSDGEELQATLSDSSTSSQKRRASSPAPGAPPSKKVRSKTDKFQETWKLRWTWLTYGGPDVGMHCTKCKAFYPSDDKAFIGRGCKDYKTSALIRHANCKKHLAIKNLDQSTRRTTLDDIASRVQLADESTARMAMETAYFCAEELLPLNKQPYDNVLMRNGQAWVETDLSP